MLDFFLDKTTYQLVEYGYLAINKRRNITCARELDLFKAAISLGPEKDAAGSSNIMRKYKLKVGHGGSLDRLASGVLAVALCKGCKMLPLLLEGDKQYRVTARLGVATDTFDEDGKVVDNCPYEHVTKAMIEDALKGYIGEIEQRPPIYSALKVGGRRASDIARYGIRGEKHIEMEPRPVTCYDVQCVDFNPPWFTLEVKCGKGFYVRSLIDDLSKALGSCGYVTDLVRTKHGQFTLDDCLNFTNYSIQSVVDAVRRNKERFPEYARDMKNGRIQGFTGRCRNHETEKMTNN